MQYESPETNKKLGLFKQESDSHDNFLDGLLESRFNPLLFDDDSVQIKKEMDR